MKKTWIVSSCLALALVAGAASANAAAAHDKWGGGWQQQGPAWNGKPGWNNGPGWPGNPGWNGGPPWLGYNQGKPGGAVCKDWDRKGNTWYCDKWASGPKYVPENVIAGQVYRAGYRHIFDIDRDGSRYKVKALDYRGRRVLLTFNARTGEFLKRKVL